MNVANALGVEPEDIGDFMLKKVGDPVKQGEILAEYRSFFGLFKHTVTSPVDATVEMISTVTGQVTLREPPIPIQVDAYIDGVVEEVLPKRESSSRQKALLQGSLASAARPRESSA